MLQVYPEHLDGRVEDASFRFSSDASETHKYSQIACPCGGRTFDLLASNHRSVVAVCSTCSSNITIYDLAFYPAAVKMAGEETFGSLKNMPLRPTEIFAMYEYGELEPDMIFDRNDITWCQIFAEDKFGALVMVFDDETG